MIYIQSYNKRPMQTMSVKDFLQSTTFPIFAKPTEDIKAFTGTVMLNIDDAKWQIGDWKLLSRSRFVF